MKSKRRKILLFFILLLVTIGSLKAQLKTFEEYQKEIETQFVKENFWYRTFNRYEVSPGFSKFSAGISQTQPVLGWSEVDPSFGIRYHQKHAELGASFWNGIEAGDSINVKANRLSVGYFTPVNALKFGNRYLDVRGFLFQPTASLGYTNTNKSHGLYVAPGLHFQFPFGLIGARANVEYTFNGGFNVFPEISLQLDGLRTLLDGQVKKIGSGVSSYTTASPIGGGWYNVSTSSYAYDVKMTVIQPFWGITPRVGWAAAQWTSNPYMNKGIGLSGRLNFLAIDIHFDKGNIPLGVVSNVTALDPVVLKDFENEKIKGTVSTTELTFEAGFNIPGLLRNLFKKGAISSMSFSDTPLNRFNFHLGVTYFIPGDIQYSDAEEAVVYTDEFFADHPDIERNFINDPLAHQKEWGVTYGLSYEMGAIGVRLNNKISSSIGKGTTLDVYYMLPIHKIMKAYSKKSD